MAGKIVSLVKDGETVGIPEEQLEEALGQGYRPETVDEEASRAKAEFEDRPIAAGLAGAARGASFGLSDVALEKTGLVEGRTLQSLTEANPTASTIGEVVGAVAPVLIPGGQFTAAGAAAKAGLAAERLIAGAAGGAARKVAASAAAGALEGALYGTGQLVTEKLIGDPTKTGEEALAGVGLSTLLGAGGGAAAKALGLGASRLLRRGGKEAVEGVADDVLEEGYDLLEGPAASHAGDTVSDAARMVDPATGELGDIVKTGEVAEGFGKRAKAALEEGVETRTGKVKQLLEDLDLDFPTAEGWVLRDLDIKSGQLAKLRDKKLNVSAPRALLEDARYGQVKTLEEKVGLIVDKKNEAGKAIGDAVKKVDEVTTVDEMFDPSAVEAELSGYIRELEKGPAGNDTVVARLKKELSKLSGRVDDVSDDAARELTPEEKVFGVRSDAPKGRAKPARELTPEEQVFGVRSDGDAVEAVTPEMSGKLSFADAEAYKRGLDNFISWDSLEPKPVQEALRKLRGAINGEIEAGVARVSKRAGLDEQLLLPWKQSKALYGQMRQLEKATAPRLAAREGNRFFSLTDNIAGAAGAVAGGPMGLVTGAAAAVVNKWARERLPQLVALKLHKMRTQPGTSAAGRAFEEFFGTLKSKVDDAATAAAAKGTGLESAVVKTAQGPGAGTAALAVQPFMDTLSSAAAQGSAALFATHAVLSEDPGYREAMQAAGLDYEGRDRGRASRLETLEARLKKSEARRDEALDAFLKGKSRNSPSSLGALTRLRLNGAGEKSAGRTEAVKQRLSEIAKLAADPEVLQARLGEAMSELSEVAPAAGTEFFATATRAVGFLQSKAPKPPSQFMDVPALRRPWTPSDADVSKFERYAAAVDNPGGVTEDMAGGVVTREAVEALQAVYPKLYEATREKLLERLATHGKALDYKQRLSLGLMLNAATDPSLEPAAIARAQSVYAPKEGQGGAPGGGGGGRAPQGGGAGAMTDTEALLARRT